MHFLLVSGNELTHEMKCNGMTSFMEFMECFLRMIAVDTALPVLVAM